MLDNNKKYFITHLLTWSYKKNKRELPWKNIRDPYKIWLSEVLLQQTKAEQALPYFIKFTRNYPNIFALASAPEDEIFKLWQGLGYYNRCKNMLFTAKYICNNLNGVFPDNYEQILQLKGVGQYTASAIASFAYNLPHAVVDGNVYRILARYFGLDVGFFNAKDKAFYHNLAQELLPKQKSAVYNQAIMDFGATVCKPALPLCKNCPLSKKCVAFNEQLVQKLPLKKTKLIIKERHFHYLVIQDKNGYYVKKREQLDVWQNLYEFYLVESDNQYLPIAQNILAKLQSPIKTVQKLTHQKIHCYFYTLNKWPKSLANKTNFILVNKNDMHNLAFPRSIAQYLQDII